MTTQRPTPLAMAANSKFVDDFSQPPDLFTNFEKAKGFGIVPYLNHESTTNLSFLSQFIVLSFYKYFIQSESTTTP